MPNKFTIVIDTNLLVSAAMSKKLRDSLFQIVTDKNITIATSTKLFEELTEVLNRSKFSSYFTQKQIDEYVDFWNTKTKFFKVKTMVKVCRDPKDDFVLSLAIFSKAKYILTGDKDLLVLNPYNGIQIITLAKFFQV